MLGASYKIKNNSICENITDISFDCSMRYLRNNPSIILYKIYPRKIITKVGITLIAFSPNNSLKPVNINAENRFDVVE